MRVGICVHLTSVHEVRHVCVHVTNVCLPPHVRLSYVHAYFLSTYMQTRIHTCVICMYSHARLHMLTCMCMSSLIHFFLIYPCTQKHSSHRHACVPTHTYWVVMASSVLPEILPYLSWLSHKHRCHLLRDQKVSWRW